MKKIFYCLLFSSVIFLSCGNSIKKDAKEYPYLELRSESLDTSGGSTIGCFYSADSKFPIAWYLKDNRGIESYYEFDMAASLSLPIFMPLNNGQSMDFTEYFKQERVFDLFEEGGILTHVYPDMTTKGFEDDGKPVAKGKMTLTYLPNLPENVIKILPKPEEKIPVSKWPKDLLRAIDRDLNDMYGSKFKVVEWNNFRKFEKTNDGIPYAYSIDVEFAGHINRTNREVMVK